MCRLLSSYYNFPSASFMSYRDQNIYVIGMPGSGKSTIGKALAAELDRHFTDLDQTIEGEEQQTIPAIFKNQGEQTFRQLETKYLKQVSSQEDLQVIATGGGTPCFHNNMEFINKSGVSVYLDIPTLDLAKRISHQSKVKKSYESHWGSHKVIVQVIEGAKK